MLPADKDVTDINPVDEPTLFAIPVCAENQIITAHHALAHLPSLPIKSPIL